MSPKLTWSATMPDFILTNPEAPLASAQRLVAEQQRSAPFPAVLAWHVLEIGHGAEFDGDDLLGRLLTALCNSARTE